jgi:beta-mannosidase
MIQHLDSVWLLRHEALDTGPGGHAAVLNARDNWLDVSRLPCDVRMPLIENGLIEDPSVGDNCFRSAWIENRSWWFLKTFTADDAVLTAHRAELVVEGMDAEADLFLNGAPLGHHRSQTYPFRAPVAHLLQPAENKLLIRVTSGLEYYCENDISRMRPHTEVYAGGVRGDARRTMIRKPAYVYGWDWNPRIVTCGIGSVRIEAWRGVAIRDVGFSTVSINNGDAKVRVSVEAETLHPTNTWDLTIGARIYSGGKEVTSCRKTIYATAGLNCVEMDLTILRALLWWPNGMGDQPLYRIVIDAEVEDGSDSRSFAAGIRTLELDTSRIDNSNRYFRFLVNGKPVFMKGGNWETPDSLYRRISDEKYDRLVKEAQNANFNMFRFTGVNAYERDAFYDACDKYGIMVWNDFTFSCSVYPDDKAWFLHECEREIEHVLRRLRNHPSLALWCGSNECQWHMQMWGFWKEDPYPEIYQGGVRIYNTLIPKLVNWLTPNIPYWNSSPFGGQDLNCNEYGDRHHWLTAFMSTDMNRRITPEIYDEVDCKFCSEFGCIGPVKFSSLRKYYGPGDIVVGSKIWELHTNTNEKLTVQAAIERHYHSKAGELKLEDYLLFAGLFQGITLGYAFEAMRNAQYNYGALLWSYNDCWGEVGWSIIDYYLTRKISYYFVKRALAHKRLIIRETNDGRIITCLNDTQEQLEFILEYGYAGFDGIYSKTRQIKAVVPPLSKTVLIKENASQFDDSNGVFFARTIDDSGLLPVILRKRNIRELNLPDPSLSIRNLVFNGSNLSFDITAGNYAHAVHFNLPDDVMFSDAYFDLLPGETRHIQAEAHEDFVAGIEIKPLFIQRGGQ